MGGGGWPLTGIFGSTQHSLMNMLYPHHHTPSLPNFKCCFTDRLCVCMLSHLSCIRLFAPSWTVAHQVFCPWDSPGRKTGVGCHFLLQCRKVKSESEIAQSCPTPSDLMDCSLPGSSIHGIFQARVLEWGAIAFSKVCCIPETNIILQVKYTLIKN